MSADRELARNTLALVLAGGNGTRLGELTRWQCKPAIPFAGHFRNIDFTLSNCMNSHVRRIAVLTQYKAQTLLAHITNGWNILPRQLGEFVDVWPAQQRRCSSWYTGTADAVYQNIDLILAQNARYTLVLAGDHVYKMDYRPLLRQHAVSGADVTIGCLPVPVEQAGAFGVLGVNDAGGVRTFVEKPAPSSLDAPNGSVLASMGIYVFRTEYLIERLEHDARVSSSAHDFGRDILPAAVRQDRVGAFRFADASGNPGYWRDVGTLEAYWQAHMELLTEEPAIDLSDPEWPLWTQPTQVAPAKVVYNSRYRSVVTNSILCGGTVVRGGAVNDSVLGPNVEVGDGTILEESVVLPGARIGANCTLRRVIIDSNTTVPDGMVVDAFEPFSVAAGEITLLTNESVRQALLSHVRRNCLATDAERDPTETGADLERMLVNSPSVRIAI